jgi:hypothetical protein
MTMLGSVTALVGLICLQVSRLCGEFTETVAITQRMPRIRVRQRNCWPGSGSSRGPGRNIHGRYGADDPEGKDWCQV